MNAHNPSAYIDYWSSVNSPPSLVTWIILHMSFIIKPSSAFLQLDCRDSSNIGHKSCNPLSSLACEAMLRSSREDKSEMLSGDDMNDWKSPCMEGSGWLLLNVVVNIVLMCVTIHLSWSGQQEDFHTLFGINFSVPIHRYISQLSHYTVI